MQKLNLLEEPVQKLFIKYLMPSISATLVTSIYILADTLMIGRGVGPVGRCQHGFFPDLSGQRGHLCRGRPFLWRPHFGSLPLLRR